MLDYVKLILQKVSFDETIFEKELKKALKIISEEDTYQFQSWCYDQFGEMHELILDEHFSTVQI